MGRILVRILGICTLVAVLGLASSGAQAHGKLENTLCNQFFGSSSLKHIQCLAAYNNGGDSGEFCMFIKRMEFLDPLRVFVRGVAFVNRDDCAFYLGDPLNFGPEPWLSPSGSL
jgi:hypothetical protein